ncbi:type II toxin-antitoxin system RelB/DinJ family antitoxin [Fusobacterium animalis]
MMSNINVMVDEEITKEATEIFTKLGFDMNTAINIFLRSAIRKKGIPFDLLVD